MNPSLKLLLILCYTIANKRQGLIYPVVLEQYIKNNTPQPTAVEQFFAFNLNVIFILKILVLFSFVIEQYLFFQIDVPNIFE